MEKKKVPEPDITALSNGVIPVSSLAVVRPPNQSAVLLEVRGTGVNAAETRYALSPPAAVRLARDLEKVVDEYLYGASDDAETG